MKKEQAVIVDTNIIFSSLLKDKSPFYELLLTGDYNFYICELTLLEIFNHKDKIIELSELSENEIDKYYYLLLRKINIFKEELIKIQNWIKA